MIKEYVEVHYPEASELEQEVSSDQAVIAPDLIELPQYPQGNIRPPRVRATLVIVQQIVARRENFDSPFVSIQQENGSDGRTEIRDLTHRPLADHLRARARVALAPIAFSQIKDNGFDPNDHGSNLAVARQAIGSALHIEQRDLGLANQVLDNELSIVRSTLLNYGIANIEEEAKYLAQVGAIAT